VGLEGRRCRGRRWECTVLNLKSSSFVISAMNRGIRSRRARGYSHFPEESARCAGTPALAMPASSGSLVHSCWSFHFPNSSVSACHELALGAHVSRLALTAFRDREWAAVRLFGNELAGILPSVKSSFPAPPCLLYSSAWMSATLSPLSRIWPVHTYIVSLRFQLLHSQEFSSCTYRVLSCRHWAHPVGWGRALCSA